MSISREKMQELDRRAIEGFGIDSILLMENAAMAVFREISDYTSYTVVCGGGNNGGDGLALARHLIVSGKEVDVLIIKDIKSIEGKKNLEILENLTERIYYIRDEKDIKVLENSLKQREVAVDSIFGIGLDREIKGLYRDVIECINKWSSKKFAIDIPSGLDANTGEVLGVCIKADKTIAIHAIKDGMVSSENTGEIKKVYIGIPEEDFKKVRQ